MHTSSAGVSASFEIRPSLKKPGAARIRANNMH